MDLDSFQNEFRAFKARVMPMLEAWEAHGGAVSPVDKETADALNAEIYKPLPPKDLSDPTIRQVVVPGSPASVAAAAAAADKSPPTVQQWVAAGYLASNYATRFPNGPSSAEDIAAAVAAEKSTAAVHGTVTVPGNPQLGGDLHPVEPAAPLMPIAPAPAVPLATGPTFIPPGAPPA